MREKTASGWLASWSCQWTAWRARVREVQLARVLYRATNSYHDHRCLFMGAALSFFATISVIPLVYTAVVVLARILGSTEAAQTQFRLVLEHYLLPPVAADAIMDRVQALLERGWIWGSGAWWGLALILWSGVRFYETLQSVFAAAWGWKPMRPFLHRHGVSAAAFMVASLLLGFAIVLSLTATTLSRASQALAGFEVGRAGLFLASGVPLLLAIVVFFMVYKFIPPVDVPWKLALTLGAGAALAWEAMRRIFLAFAGATGVYSDIYGPLSSLMLLLVWVYATSSIVLFGAELGAAWQQDQAEQLAARRVPLLPGLPTVLGADEPSVSVS